MYVAPLLMLFKQVLDAIIHNTRMYDLKYYCTLCQFNKLVEKNME